MGAVWYLEVGRCVLPVAPHVDIPPGTSYTVASLLIELKRMIRFGHAAYDTLWIRCVSNCSALRFS